MKSTASWKKSTPWTHDHISLTVRRDLILELGHFLVLVRQLARPPQALLLVLIVLLRIRESSCGSSSSIGGINTAIVSDIKEATWQNCDVFMAPTNTTAGWGVFAARDFEFPELLDIPPFFLAFEDDRRGFSFDSRLIKSSALDDYVYGVHRRHRDTHQRLVIYGYEMMFNHHPNANVELGMSSGYAQGFYSKRKILAGEQLFSSYGQGDGGKHWFESRGLPMRLDRSNIDSLEQLEFLKTLYCTKIYAGPGPSNFQQLIPPVDHSRIAPFDAGLFDARAKVPIKAGDRIEQGPAMLLYKPFVDDTAMGPLVISWDSLLPQHQETLRSASKSLGEKLPIQYQGEASQWERIRRLAGIEKVAILPFAGRIGLVRRVHNGSTTPRPGGGDSSNCRLDIDVDMQVMEGDDVPFVSVILTLVATEDIEVGQVLKMDLKPAGSAYEKELLKSKLSETGHVHAIIAS